MRLLIDSFWRAALYCLHPRVIALSLLPLVLIGGLAFGLGYFFWEPALDTVREALDSYSMLSSLWSCLQSMGVGNLKTVVAPLIVIFAMTPLLVLVCLLVVAMMMTPAMTRLVHERRFPQMERKGGGSLIGSIFWSIGSTLLALIALLVSIPLWLIPPLILIVPPLIWGWLTYRVMAFDVLAAHASADERKEIFRTHRSSLLAIGILCGYLGAAPSLLWASGAVFAAAFVILLPVAVWMYTVVFAFCSLWFAHYALAALQTLRAAQSVVVVPDSVVVTTVPAIAAPNGANTLTSADDTGHRTPS